MSRTERPPLAVRLATLFATFTAAMAALEALAGHHWVLAAAVVAGAAATMVSMRSRGPRSLALSWGLTAAVCGWWTVIEGTSRHVLNFWPLYAFVLAGLLLVRPDSRTYLRLASANAPGVTPARATR